LGGMNPRQMQKLMAQMGIKNEELEAKKVVIEKPDGSKIVIDDPSVTAIEMGGQKSFQITGEAREEKAGEGAAGAGGEDDAALVMKGAGCSREEAEKALREAGGDIAKAILSLEK